MYLTGANLHVNAATSSNRIDRSLIDLAVAALRRGELVAFPTETVYGLGADASNAEALSRLYRVKGRPAEHPVIVHIAGAGQLADWAKEVPDAARKLAEAFWPGPLTMVLRKSPSVPGQVTGGQDTVAIRIPRHPIALSLLEAFGGGIAAPSANRFGHLSPTVAAAVVEELGDDVSIVLDGGPCKVGIESTIVNLCGDGPEILRLGMIPGEQIERVLCSTLRCVAASTTEEHPTAATRVPGGLPKHYAPRTPLTMVVTAELSALIESLDAEGKRLSVLS